MNNTERPAQLRKQRIVLCALECFCKHGIQATTISQIATAAQVGEATIYRYFMNKPELVYAASNIIWEHMLAIYNRLMSDARAEDMSGIDHLALFSDVPIVLLDEKAIYLKFIYDFDRYLHRLSNSQNPSEHKNTNIRSFKDQFSDIIMKGQLDGSINDKYKQEEILWLLLSTLFSLTDKLFIGSPKHEHSHESSRKQFQTAHEIVINGLRPLARV